MTAVEYGLRWERDDGSTYTEGRYHLKTALLFLDVADSLNPRPVRVMVRDVTEWRPYEDDGK